MAAAGEPLQGAGGPQTSDAENADPTEAGSLRKMFVQGTEAIQTKRTDNLFQSLEERTLTEDEQRIIEQRVALQRKMFEEYERRERKRKVVELQDVCPDISEEEAEKALELCDGREDEAAAQLVSDAGFRLRVQAACGPIAAAEPVLEAAPPARREGSSRSHRRYKPAGPRPKVVDPATLGSTVFVGAFRGKGFKPPPKGRQPARKAAPTAAAAKAAGAGALHSADDEETETEGEQEPEEQEEQQEAMEGQQEQQQQQEQQAQHPQQDASLEQQQPLVPGVMLWPQAAAAAAAAQLAAEAAEPQPAAGADEPQRYVLVHADTLEAPSDSLLRSARRQLGEPSDSRVPLGTDATGAAAAGAEPASVARSRPLAAVAEEEQQEQEDGAPQAAQQQQQQQQQQDQPEQQQQQAGAAVAGQGGSAQPSAAALAAMAKQLSKLDDGKARALLRRMGGGGVREAVLEQLGAFDPDRAAACFALLGDDADEFEEEAAEEWGSASDDEEWQQPSGAQQQPSAARQQPSAAQQQQQQQQQVEAAAAEEAGEAPSAQRVRSRRTAAAGARRAVKRAASAALSDSEATETEEEPSSDEEMGGGASSSEDDEFVAPRSSRRSKAPPAKRQARPSRAAKNAAAAAFVAMAAVSGGQEGGSNADMGEADATSSDDEAARSQRQQRGGSKARGGRQQRASPSPAPAGAPAASGSAPPSTKRQRMEEVQQGSAVAAAAFAAAAAAAAGAGQAADSAGAAAEQEQPTGSGGGAEQPPARQQRAAAAAAAPCTRAISATGHTCRGRVKQKSHKSADLVVAGRLRAEKGWFNAGYIFPEGFQSRTLFRSSVAIDQLCVHECHIIGEGGQFWPAPTFKVVALDRPDEPLIAKSCTGCWTGILKRINAEIEARRRAGEDLPPPPKTAIAGPEYFGLNQPNIQSAVEALDPHRLCTEYWAGKEDRMAAAAGRPPVPGGAARAQRAQRQPAAATRRAGGSKKGRRRGGESDSEGEEAEAEGEDDETQYMATKWSAVSRTERYRKRLEENGEDVSALDQDNPLPSFIDPITMSAVVRPAISPYGHVAGLATWKVVLAEKQQCPFTNQPLQFEQLKVLTKTNIHLWRDKIVNGPGQKPA
ncbi:Transforming growth factor beta regulator 1 [Chlorella sorokiniana]|uniref:Transforming growth factor beta regulator 1 n=1 Tax=Chlorella sorokiniana TaxID=3076 RepID=A0A2P6TEL1_CHLSO|nr:Transforming growth factor beta regulator 1 [Chlorella sorokiniana]|eukprot:PRW21070.1 Transforming growth factor beta regulator 1 [Chlorella sorokiniana]